MSYGSNGSSIKINCPASMVHDYLCHLKPSGPKSDEKIPREVVYLSDKEMTGANISHDSVKSPNYKTKLY